MAASLQSTYLAPFYFLQARFFQSTEKGAIRPERGSASCFCLRVPYAFLPLSTPHANREPEVAVRNGKGGAPLLLGPVTARRGALRSLSRDGPRRHRPKAPPWRVGLGPLPARGGRGKRHGRQGDLEGRTCSFSGQVDSLCSSERKRVEEKQKHAPVWEFRKKPPLDWHLPLNEEKPK
ncbi:UPF0545 protein C22orf39 homolog isoform X1 [Varanus komodoensis]|uniref:UPF0545 protein C22orf39 homolog isoform X1 n=1 Tax=Varanus komodoensis TaxID=61221 RepID=UPI001CF7C404|nr:UPF0545 protein C22orf39 homolog isoform X1 [Varanus komodoensis]